MNFRKKLEKDLTKERDDRCGAAANKLLKIIGDSKGIYLGNDPEKKVAHYNQLIEDTIQLYIDEGVLLSEIQYVSQITLDILGHVQDWVGATIKKHNLSIQEDTMGKPEYELTIADLNKKIIEIEGKKE